MSSRRCVPGSANPHHSCTTSTQSLRLASSSSDAPGMLASLGSSTRTAGSRLASPHGGAAVSSFRCLHSSLPPSSFSRRPFSPRSPPHDPLPPLYQLTPSASSLGRRPLSSLGPPPIGARSGRVSSLSLASIRPYASSPSYPPGQSPPPKFETPSAPPLQRPATVGSYLQRIADRRAGRRPDLAALDRKSVV